MSGSLNVNKFLVTSPSMRKRVQRHVPNAITCANLFSGCVGIVLTLSDSPDSMHLGAYCIFLAAIFDFFDGFASRVLKATTGIGKDLDSLADMVSFGVLPAVILFEFFKQSHQIPHISTYLNYVAFLIPVFSALRLAKFNIDTRQAEKFIGLPTPANAILIASFPLIHEHHNTFYSTYITNPIILAIFTIVMCTLLVAELPLLSLKFKNTDLHQNIYRYLLLLFSAILILFFKFAAVPVIIFLYIVLSIIQFKIDNDKVSG